MQTPEQQLLITGLEPLPEGGVVISYGRFPEDVRKNGLMWQHSVNVPAGTDYDDELTTLMDALRTLLLDVLDDETRAEPVDIEEEEEDEDEDE